MPATEGKLRVPTDEILDAVEKVIIGKDHVVRLALCALVAGGHVLIEDRPGVGKTTLAKALSLTLGCAFKRIQFTPDLLPADVTGVSVFNQKEGEFEFRPGPIFSQILLADEINRTTPKTQSSLLEAMEEFQVTVDGVSYALPRPFFVVATQNNIEFHGTYPLPEAQMDRFLMRIEIGYPTAEEETRILGSQLDHHPLGDVKPMVGPDQIIAIQAAAHHVRVEESLQRYIVDLTAQTRKHPGVSIGASPRASLGLMGAARAWALLDGRDYCVPDDIKRLAVPVLAHRIIVGGRGDAFSGVAVVEETLRSIPVPVL